MKKALIVLACLSSVQAYACVVELQYQGSVLGRNVFSEVECRDALRACKIAEKTYERQNNLTELACVTVDNGTTNPYPPTNPNPNPNPYPPTNPNPNPYPPTDPNPYPPTNPSPSYTRLEALNALKVVENSSQDADSDLNVILDELQRNVGSLYELTDSFIRLLDLAGGSSKTTETQLLFKKYADLAISENLSMTEVVNAFEVISRSENSASDSDQAMSLATNLSHSHNISLYEAAQVYADIIRAEGGDSKTSETGSVMRFLTNLNSREKRNSVNYYLEIRALENSYTDSQDLLTLVLKAVEVGVRPSEAQDTMLSLLRQYGNSGTSTIKQKYKNMFRI